MTDSPAQAAQPEIRRGLSRAAIAGAAVFLLLALATRFYDLGARPMHHDESIHAFQSYTLSKDGTWRYDPAYHGPFLYYANALVYKVLGVTDTTARLLPAAFGLLLIAFAWPLARWIGRGPAAAYAVFVLISPHLTYFSRFIREDLYSLVFTLGTIVAFRLYLDTDRTRWLILSAVSFALAGATKENAYMTGVLFVAFGAWTFAERAVREKAGGSRVKTALAETRGWVAPRLALLVSAGAVFLLIWTMMYTAFGKYPGDWLAIPKAVRYWMGQHAIARIPGPWYYYLPILAFYETAAVVAACFAFRRKEERANPFLRFVAFWTVGSLLLYAWAREKVPWLTVHSLLPIAILASVGVVSLWRGRQRMEIRLALGIVALLACVNASGMFLASFRYGAHDRERAPRHAEMLAYVQTSRELIRALQAVEIAKRRVAPGEPPIAVAGDAGWPLTWYLRDTPTRWAARIEEASTPIIVDDWDADGLIEKQLAERYDAKRVPIRSWWFPERVKGTGGVPDRPTFTDLLRFWLFHEIWSPIGSQDATFFTRKDLAGEGPLAPLTVRVESKSALDYPAEAATVPPGRSWGGAGGGPGEFGEPRGLASGPEGNLYVADTKNSRIQVFGPQGEFLREFGRKGNGDGELTEPCGVAVDSEGQIWVADTWNHRIVRFGPDGRFHGAFADPDGPLFGPRSILVSRGTVYVSDTGNKRVLRFDREGRKLSAWGSGGGKPGEFIEPVGLAADSAGNIYVADTGNHRIQVFDAGGKFLREFPVFGWKDFYTEPYLVIGPAENVFVTDSSASRVAQYDATGNLKRSWKPEGLFKAPTGIALDSFGRLTVSDRGTSRVHAWGLSEVAVP